ncbi:transposase [Paraburkholderia unamae]|uniref:transposase n=1 Tax=Paraburkholderia unamae TaxID=219649 RepID=UPI000DD3DBE9
MGPVQARIGHGAQTVELSAKRQNQRHPLERKRSVVERTFDPGAAAPRIARENNINANQVWAWRKLYTQGLLVEDTTDRGWPLCGGRPTSRTLRRPETFAFLGFIFICGRSRRGAFLLKRKSRGDRMRAKLRECATPILLSGPLGHVPEMPGHVRPKYAARICSVWARAHLETSITPRQRR